MLRDVILRLCPTITVVSLALREYSNGRSLNEDQTVEERLVFLREDGLYLSAAAVS